MAVGFGAVTFRVLTPDAEMSAEAPDEFGWTWYAATVRVLSAADVATLRTYVSRVTPKPAIGFVGGGLAVVEAGVGVRTLTLPVPGGTEKTFDAILTELRPLGTLTDTTAWMVEAVWLLTAETTP